MNALVLMAQAESSGQIEQIARTFGVDWPHLIAQMISFCIMCFLLYRFAYGPVLQMLANRRRLIAESLANADKVKAELARTETQRKEVMAQANAQATQFIEEARAAADVLLKQETKNAQGTSGRGAGPRPYACRTQARGWPAGCTYHQRCHRENPDDGRSAAIGRGNRRAVGRMITDGTPK